MSPRTEAQFEAIRQARTEEIVAAARQVFADRGFHATRMSDIARTAGVSQGTLYHYFRSKDDLFLALLFTWAERLETVVKELPDVQAGAAEKIGLMTQVGQEFLATNQDLLPVILEFWAYALRHPKAAASFRHLFEVMQQSFLAILEEGIATGEFKPTDLDALSALPLVVLDGVIVLSLLAGRDLVDPDRIFKNTEQLVLDALQGKPGERHS
jgi:AcrR family transcriptional regulator